VSLGVEQSAIVVLAVNLDRQRTNVAKQAGGNCSRADEGPTAAVTFHRAANDQWFPRIEIDALLGEKLMRGMIAGKLDFCGNRGTVLSSADEGRIRAHA